MVSKVEERMKRIHHHYERHNKKQVQKVRKFKRSSSNVEEDGASSAILFLACIACAPCYLIMHALTNN
ncbi:hypothetical protein HN51_046031 [Arachis hypogaea]